MIVIKEPHALKVSFVTVMLKARHHCVSWGNCVAVFVCVPGLFCFHQWVSLSLLVVVLGVYFCWSLTLCPRHTHTQMHTHMGTYTVHTHRYTHTQISQRPFILLPLLQCHSTLWTSRKVFWILDRSYRQIEEPTPQRYTNVHQKFRKKSWAFYW